MASINLEDEELMEQDYYGDDYDEDEVPEMPPMMAPLSPLAEYNENATNQTASEQNPLDGLLGDAGADEGSETKARRIIKRKPQPKLDEARLTGPKGLPSLQKHFEKVKFKGKGHEHEDLNLLMTEMEHWMNRLYPKLTMKEMIVKLEKLGKKQKVKTCLAKIRMDMPILDEDFIGRDDDLDEEENIAEEMNDEEDGVTRGEDEESRGNERLISSQSESKPTLTEDQKKRIEEKRRLALERKAAKQAKEQEEELGGLSQEELESIQNGEDLKISRMEAKMFQEIADTERELGMVGGEDGTMESKSKEENPVGNSLSQEEMDEIERELMG